MTPPLKFQEKGIFKSEPRARALAKKLKDQGKTVRVERQHLPAYGGAAISGLCFVLKVKAKKPFFGRNYIIDTKV
jgi:hypothetical protein